MAVGVGHAAGFRAAGVVAGIKASGRPDVAIVCADAAVPAAAVFTRSRTAAPPVLLSRRHAAGGAARAVVVSSGNANAATGAAGLRDAERMAALVAAGLGCRPEEVLVASTGVIGVPLPMERIEAGIADALDALSPDGGAAAAEAITTTDAAPKTAERELVVDGASVRIGGMAKGAGMIRPDLGTMIAVLTTDAVLDAVAADRILRRAVAGSFNRITVDGCQSTSDTVVLLASGASGAEVAASEPFAAALDDACLDLALQIVRDGEGARRVARWRVTGARTEEEAVRLAYAVAEGQLARCALHGGDPNWGRIFAALGVVGVDVDPDRIGIAIGGHVLCRAGVAVAPDDPAALDAAAAADTVAIDIELGLGDGSAVVWGSDLSADYVALNAEYTT